MPGPATLMGSSYAPAYAAVMGMDLLMVIIAIAFFLFAAALVAWLDQV